MNLFYEIKNRTSLIDIVRAYGIKLTHSNMICCPFHEDKTPSMKVYDRGYCCYGCGEKGDTISFVSKLFNISPYEAACKINSDFGLGLNVKEFPKESEISERESLLSKRKEEEATEKSAWKTLSTYYRYLKNFNLMYSPKSPEEPLNLLFVESLQQTEKVSFLCNCLISLDFEKRIEILNDFKEDISYFQKRLTEFKSIEPPHSVVNNLKLLKTSAEQPTKHKETTISL